MKILILVATVLLASSLTTFRAQDAPPYRDPYTGQVQPAVCDNSFKNEHPCMCRRTSDEDCSSQKPVEPGANCRTFCRKNDCHCVNSCS